MAFLFLISSNHRLGYVVIAPDMIVGNKHFLQTAAAASNLLCGRLLTARSNE